MFEGLQRADPEALEALVYPGLGESTSEQGSIRDSKIDFLSAIQKSVYCQCTDDRDRIYAVMGMTSATSKNRFEADENVPTLKIDYTRSAGEVFQDAARYVMLSDRNCSLLCLDGQYGGMIGNEYLPSWCPNWSKPFYLDYYRSRTCVGPGSSSGNFYFEDRKLYIRALPVGSALLETTEGNWEPRTTEVIILNNARRVETYFGHGSDVKNGDVVVAMKFCCDMLVLRPSAKDSYYVIVGRARVLGSEWTIPRAEEYLDSHLKYFTIV
jgi:hypothetical protein